MGEELGLVADELDVGEAELYLLDLAQQGRDGFSEVVGEGEVGEVKLGGVGVALILMFQQLGLEPVQLLLLSFCGFDHSEPQ